MAKKTKKYALGGQLSGPQVMPAKPMGAPSGPPKSVPVRPMGPANTANAIPPNVSAFLAANKNGALTKAPSWADSMQTALKNAPRVTPEIQGMADMSRALAGGPKPNPLNPTGSLNGPRFGGMGMKKGGKVKKMASGGKTSQLAKANGIAVRGKSRGRIV